VSVIEKGKRQKRAVHFTTVTSKLLAKALIAWRDKNGVTQEELARRVGCSKQSISHYETGRGYPSVETMDAISREIGFHPVVNAANDGFREALHIANAAFSVLETGVLREPEDRERFLKKSIVDALRSRLEGRGEPIMMTVPIIVTVPTPTSESIHR
jgi:transcriptional regulator with XRE-family HTH domain